MFVDSSTQTGDEAENQRVSALLAVRLPCGEITVGERLKGQSNGEISDSSVGVLLDCPRGVAVVETRLKTLTPSRKGARLAMKTTQTHWEREVRKSKEFVEKIVKDGQAMEMIGRVSSVYADTDLAYQLQQTPAIRKH